MSYEETLKSISLTADASIGVYTGVPGLPGSPSPHGAKQYHALKITGVGQAGVADALGGVVGVLQNKPQGVGHAATVGYIGVTNVIAGGAVTAGDAVKPDADGKAVTATLPGDAGLTFGVALGTSTGADQMFPVLLKNA